MIAAAAAYLAALAALGVLPWWGLTAAAAALVLAAVWVQRAGGGRTQVVLAAWPPLHVLLFATGSADSPLIALAAAWVAALGRAPVAARIVGWMMAALLVPAAQWFYQAPPTVPSLVRYELLLAIAAALSALRRERTASTACWRAATGCAPPPS